MKTSKNEKKSIKKNVLSSSNQSIFSIEIMLNLIMLKCGPRKVLAGYRSFY